MKKIISVLTASILCVGLISGCSSSDNSQLEKSGLTRLYIPFFMHRSMSHLKTVISRKKAWK